MKVLVSVRSKAIPTEIVNQYVCSIDKVSAFIENANLDKDHYVIVESIDEFEV